MWTTFAATVGASAGGLTGLIFITIPQPINALGIELVASSLVSLTRLVRLDKAARLGTGTRARPALVIALGTFAAGILVAGAFCVAGSGAAMNLYALSALTGLAWGPMSSHARRASRAARAPNARFPRAGDGRLSTQW